MSNYIVVYFESDNSFTIIEDSKNKFKNCSSAKVNFNDIWYKGQIVFSGSKKKCQCYADYKLRSSKFVVSDESDVESDDESNESQRFQNYKETAFQKEIEKIRACKRNNEEPLEESAKKRKCLEILDDSIEDQFDENINALMPNLVEKSKAQDQAEPVSNDQPCSNLNREISLTNNDWRELYVEQNEKLEKMLKTIDHLNENFTHLRNQSKNTQENDEVLLYNGTNLLGIPEHLPNKYVNACMRVLFTQDELADGFIVNGKKKSKTKRKQLDTERIDILKRALELKSKKKLNEKESFWLRMRNTANRLCYDTSKKIKENLEQAK